MGRTYDRVGHRRTSANSRKSSGGEKEVMWKSCSRATKPLLQIKLYGSKEGVRQIEGERKRERRGNCRGKIRSCGLAPACYVEPSCMPQGQKTREEEEQTGRRRWRGGRGKETTKAIKHEEEAAWVCEKRRETLVQIVCVFKCGW